MSKYWITKPFFETTDPQYVQQRIDVPVGVSLVRVGNVMLRFGQKLVDGF